MFRRKLLCSVCVHALLLMTLLVNDVGRIVNNPYDEPEDVPAPNRLQLFVVGNAAPSSAASVSATTSASATMSTVIANVDRGNQWFVDMVTGNEYASPPVDHRERPAFVSDVRSIAAVDRRQYGILQANVWRGMATGEQPMQDANYMARTFKII